MISRLVLFQLVISTLIWGVDYASRLSGMGSLLLFGADSTIGYLRFVIAVELATVIFLGFRRIFYSQTRSSNLSHFSGALLLLVLSASLLGLLQSFGRPVLSISPILPGAVPSRLFLFNSELWVRRLFEPSWLILLVALYLWGRSSTRRVVRTLSVAAANVVLLMTLEAISIATSDLPLLRFLHIAAVQGVLVFLFAALFKEGAWDERASTRLSFSLLAALPFFGLVAGYLFTLGSVTLNKPQIGAHYYLWFPYNWKHGVVGQELEPPVEPLLGRYSSEDYHIFRQHVAWARESGINYFIFDWWPERKNLRSRLFQHVTRGMNDEPTFKFSIQYETLDLKSSERTKVPGEAQNMLVLNEERAKRMALNWEHIARHYMNHPSYLRIDGRPVLFVYASRHLLGDVHRWIVQAKRHVLEKTGLELYLVGDEVFFNVPSGKDGPSTRLLARGKPDWNRISVFDAITSYNTYDSSKGELGGSEGAPAFLRKTSQLYGHYQAVAASMGQLFIPGVIPGYNDRAVRLNEQHYVVPREMPDGSSFFSRMLSEAALPTLDKSNPVLAITSWNEWNEGTQIEPTKSSPETIFDSSLSKTLFSQGEIYKGYACQHLTEIEEFSSQLVELSTRSTE